MWVGGNHRRVLTWATVLSGLAMGGAGRETWTDSVQGSFWGLWGRGWAWLLSAWSESSHTSTDTWLSQILFPNLFLIIIQSAFLSSRLKVPWESLFAPRVLLAEVCLGEILEKWAQKQRVSLADGAWRYSSLNLGLTFFWAKPVLPSASCCYIYVDTSEPS